jgi:hypothetical protein
MRYTDLMKVFIVYWRTTINGLSNRGGDCVITARDKTAAKRKIRTEVFLSFNEKLIVTSVEPV